MLHVSYEILGVCVVALLVGCWAIKKGVSRKSPKRGDGVNGAAINSPCTDHDIEHRALMFLMAQRTDSILGALARTIEQERQKLGTVVRKPSMDEALGAYEANQVNVPENGQSLYDRVLSMARSGITASKISRQLQLPEAEVSMIMRLDAA